MRSLPESSRKLTPVSHLSSTQYSKSLDEGIIPKDWRPANVTLIFKKSDRSKQANYRPVSLTCIACKILEHTVVKNMVSHLEEHHILIDSQHGFCSGHSYYSQLLLITTQDLAKYLDSKTQLYAAILDFNKA